MNNNKFLVINFNKNIFYIKLKNASIEIFNSTFHRTIQQNVEMFDVKYSPNFIFILFLTFDSKLGLIKLNISQLDDIIIQWLKTSSYSYRKMDFISLEITKTSIHFFYRLSNLKNTISYIYHGIVSNSCQSYELCKINSLKYSCPLYTTLLDDKLILLICEDYNKNTYSLREIDDNNSIKIKSFDIPNAFAVNVLSAENEIIIFYNKTLNKDIFLFQRSITCFQDKFLFSEESQINVNVSITKPMLSFYNNKFYLNWSAGLNFYITTSYDLKNWTSVVTIENNNNNIAATIFKISSTFSVFNGFISEKIFAKSLFYNELLKNDEVPNPPIAIPLITTTTSTDTKANFDTTENTVTKNNDKFTNYLLSIINSLTLKYLRLLHEKDKEIDSLKTSLNTTNKQFEKRVSRFVGLNIKTRKYYEDLISNLLNVIDDKSKIIDELLRLNNKNNK
ncbi:hypothetical protein JHL18_20300 [Clostridium sp. YIM B02505]|uniref:Uncharacterized protein n=1 Tax=Clostridium yunnanense TaxID=2800325 RepID=A0ABS1EUF1_9CLOT|nr:hypothetical protein [Clostridium yunnanense]MBK1812969.1 hypothetical protein [Clostridium yunnanense]